MIDYTLTLDDGRAFHFQVDLHRVHDPKAGQPPHPFWTRLDFRQCTNCPLKVEQHRYCPAALDIEQLVAAFGDVVSFHQVNVEVRTPERTYSKRTDAQTALRSLMGLYLATGACPVLSRMKGPAHVHLPFASVEETIFRMTGAYLLQQYFVARDGGKPDWELQGLNQFYEQIQDVNCWLKRRIDDAAEKDASLNAVVSLVNLAMTVTMSVEERLEEVKHLALDLTPGK